MSLFDLPQNDPDLMSQLQHAVDGDRHAVHPYAFPGRRDLYVKPDGSVWAVQQSPQTCDCRVPSTQLRCDWPDCKP